MKLTGAMVTLCLLLVPVMSWAAFRCGNRVVKIGDSKGDVRIRCGKPDLITRETIDASGQRRHGKKTSASQVVEVWTYNRGEKRLVKILRFQGSRLMRTEDGDYGTGPTR